MFAGLSTWCRSLCCLGGSSSSSYGSSEVGNLTGGHSAQSSVTSQDLWDAGIGRANPNDLLKAPIPILPPTPPPKWVPAGRIPAID